MLHVNFILIVNNLQLMTLIRGEYLVLRLLTLPFLKLTVAF